MSKILVTGGSGFIGTNLTDNLLINKNDILNLDITSPKKVNQLKFWKKVDINNYDLLSQVINNYNPDYIIHLAARTDLGGVGINDYTTNTLGVNNIIKVARALPSLKKIIITSSMLVCHGGYKPKNQFDFAPTTTYGESKVETEKIVWANKPDCDWSIIRPTSIWGPWFGIPYKNFFDMILAKKYFHIGNKSCTKTYGYVGNAIYQIEQILFSDTKDETNKVFYIGDYLPTNIEEWGNEIAHELGFKINKVPYLLIKMAALFGDSLKLVGINFPMTSFRLHNMTTDNIMDLSNTNKVAPNLPFSRKEGIKTTLEWIKNHSSK